MSKTDPKEIIRALLLVADVPLTLRRIEQLLGDDRALSSRQIREAIMQLQQEMDGSSVELVEVASGYRLQVRKEMAPWVSRLWDDKPQKYSRALLETLALICYRQPLTRGDIEEIRGVTLSANILKTLFEREWVREVGHREGPGRPALLATTRQFLDDLNLRSLEDLPPLPELTDPEKLEAALVRLAPKDQVMDIHLQLAAESQVVEEPAEQADTESDEEDSAASDADIAIQPSGETTH